MLFMRKKLILSFFIFLFNFFPLILFASGDKSNDEVFATVDQRNVKILEKNGYKLERLNLKSSPNLYKVKNQNAGTLTLIAEKFLIKQKVVRKEYKVTANDTYYEIQWNIPKIKADEAWSSGATGSNTITVAVLDTGLNIGRDPVKNPVHEDLVGRLWQNTGETADNSIDDDGNGKIDDTDGWNFVENNNNPSPIDGGSVDGDFRHGTLVAGVIGANTDNSKGVAGLDWNTKIMPLRVMDNNGNGWTDDIAFGIEYAADNGAKVINMSLGYAHEYGPDPTLEAAINYAHERGVVLVAASGNDALGVNYPAASPNVIAVGATDQNDNRASFSSYGPELDVVAPGVSIPTTGINWDGSAYTSNTYWSAGGTSLATPHVAALVGLIASEEPSYTNSQIEAVVGIWANKVFGTNGQSRDDQYGFGRIETKDSIFNSRLMGASDTGRVYYVNTNKEKHPFNNAQTFISWGFSWSDVGWGTESLEESFSTANNITSLPRSIADGKIYLVENSQKRWIQNQNAFSLYGLNWEEVSDTEPETISLLSDGPDIAVPSNCEGSCIMVHRFYNFLFGNHLYTTNEEERNRVMTYVSTYRYEGRSNFGESLYQVGRVPVHRFYNFNKGFHFYTANQSEATLINDSLYSSFRYEGVAYYSYLTPEVGTVPNHRFYNKINGSHFYTTNQAEATYVNDSLYNTYKYEGVAWYPISL